MAAACIDSAVWWLKWRISGITINKMILVGKGIEMKHAREDYNSIQDTTTARQLAELVLSMQMVTDKGLLARRLAREVLGIDNHGKAPDDITITTNGTTRLIPRDEPVFLIRGQDVVGGAVVRAWADLAEVNGASAEILCIAREHAGKMDAWPKKKIADLPK